MKFLSFKIFILCILMPPILYIFSVEAVQKIYIKNYLTNKYTSEIENINIGDTRPLFTGSVQLKDIIYKNIQEYLKSKALIELGVEAKITVLTRKGTILYPPIFEIQKDIMSLDHVQIAADNLKLMNEGLVVNVDLMLGYNTMLSLLILAFYVSVSMAMLYFHYKTGIRRARREERSKNKEIKRLLELKNSHTNMLQSLEDDRERLTNEFKNIKKALEKEKAKAIRNEDEMVEEIIALEEKINKNLSLQNKQKDEINALKDQIKLFEKDKRKEVNKKDSKLIQKRLKTLYKNIIFNPKTFSGFISLEDDLKIKGEEVIHQLNQDPDLISIKRKVFGKKGRQTVLEVVFAYKGRLYFRKTKDNKIEILTIGTKNTQAKDLEFLNKI